MSDLDAIRTIKSQTLAIIQQITAEPKPSYWVDDQRIYWTEYLNQLRETVAWCDRQLKDEEPIELHTKGFTP